MALLKIARMGHPVLRVPAKPVEDPAAPWVRRLVEDMVETMEDAGGTGIAAPQVHMPWRVVVFRVGGERLTDLPGDAEQDLTVLINPVIEPVGDEIALGWEGCLSVPGLRGVVPRHLRIRYRGDRPGRRARSSARPPAFTPASCSTSAITSTAFSTRSASPTTACSVFVEELQRHPLDVAALLAERDSGDEKPVRRQRARAADRGDPAGCAVRRLVTARAARRGAARRYPVRGSDGAVPARRAGHGRRDEPLGRPPDAAAARNGAAASARAEPLGLSRRVALAMHIRFEVLLPWREAVRRGLSVLALPHNAPLGLRLLYDSVDAIWQGVGDHPTDFSFYTKRASLAAILAAATLYWLDDRSPNFEDTDAFVERRLADLYRLTGIRRALRRRLRRSAEPVPAVSPVALNRGARRGGWRNPRDTSRQTREAAPP